MKRLLITALVPACFLATQGCAAQHDAGMQEHMQHMRQTMEQMHSETDPARREALRQEHHAMMRESMAVMEHEQDTTGLSLEERVTRLEEHSAMMQMMMGQMMEMHAPAAAAAQDPVDPAPGHTH